MYIPEDTLIEGLQIDANPDSSFFLGDHYNPHTPGGGFYPLLLSIVIPSCLILDGPQCVMVVAHFLV